MTGTLMPVLWVAAGAIAGVAQATGLWRTAHARTKASWIGIGRVAVVVAVLTAAALGRHLLAAVGGWFAGFVVTSVVLYLGRES